MPTVWDELLRHLRQSGTRVPSLRRVIVGGSAMSPAMVEEFTAHGVAAAHAWGMTEMSPLGTITSAAPAMPGMKRVDEVARITRQGGRLFPVEIEIFGDDGQPCAHDDVSAGALKARGPTIAQAYYRTGESCLDEAGWFDTGDIATIDAAGSLRLVDRAKNVIKSGGEWISSIALENLTMTCPGVLRAAVVALPDPKWGERPLLVVEANADEAPSPAMLVDHLRDLVPKWWLPAKFAYCPIPIGATGKVDKKALRALLSSVSSPELQSL